VSSAIFASSLTSFLRADSVSFSRVATSYSGRGSETNRLSAYLPQMRPLSRQRRKEEWTYPLLIDDDRPLQLRLELDRRLVQVVAQLGLLDVLLGILDGILHLGKDGLFLLERLSNDLEVALNLVVLLIELSELGSSHEELVK
jgi:hypothetical protein